MHNEFSDQLFVPKSTIVLILGGFFQALRSGSYNNIVTIAISKHALNVDSIVHAL